MKPETRNILLIVAGVLVLLFLLAKRNARPMTAATNYQPTTQRQGVGASLLGTLITTAGSVASSIWGAGSEGYTYEYTESSARIGDSQYMVH